VQGFVRGNLIVSLYCSDIKKHDCTEIKQCCWLLNVFSLPLIECDRWGLAPKKSFHVVWRLFQPILINSIFFVCVKLCSCFIYAVGYYFMYTPFSKHLSRIFLELSVEFLICWSIWQLCWLKPSQSYTDI